MRALLWATRTAVHAIVKREKRRGATRWTQRPPKDRESHLPPPFGTPFLPRHGTRQLKRDAEARG